MQQELINAGFEPKSSTDGTYYTFGDMTVFLGYHSNRIISDEFSCILKPGVFPIDLYNLEVAKRALAFLGFELFDGSSVRDGYIYKAEDLIVKLDPSLQSFEIIEAAYNRRLWWGPFEALNDVREWDYLLEPYTYKENGFIIRVLGRRVDLWRDIPTAPLIASSFIPSGYYDFTIRAPENMPPEVLFKKKKGKYGPDVYRWLPYINEWIPYGFFARLIYKNEKLWTDAPKGKFLKQTHV